MKEKILNNKKNGMSMLLLFLFLYLLSIGAIVAGGFLVEYYGNPVLLIIGILYAALGWIPFCGLKAIKPQEALVLTLFGEYVGTLKDAGFYFINPFCSGFNPAAKTKLNQSGDVKEKNILGNLTISTEGTATSAEAANKKISLKVMTLSNNRQKINDCLGNPIEIGIADEGSLRGSSEVVAERIRAEIQKKVSEAGLEILEARITYLAYAPEIAAVMLQRQQASAIIDARKMIVDGAVGMVEMALERLSEKEVVTLDEERKAAMVSNLLVVLCGNRDAQPIVNSGSLY